MVVQLLFTLQNHCHTNLDWLLLHGIGLYPSLLRIKSKLGSILSIMNICSALVQSVERAFLSLYHMTDMLNVNDAAISCSSLTLPQT